MEERCVICGMVCGNVLCKLDHALSTEFLRLKRLENITKDQEACLEAIKEIIEGRKAIWDKEVLKTSLGTSTNHASDAETK